MIFSEATSDTPNTQPEVIRLISKYYPDLGKHLLLPNLAELASEWYSDLTVIGVEGLEYFVTDRHAHASNKQEFLRCLAELLAEAEKYAHIPGYGYRRHYLHNELTTQRKAEIEASGKFTLRAVRNWYDTASLTPVERFLDRARKIELWQNNAHQLATRSETFDEWQEEYGVAYLSFKQAIPSAKKRLLRAAYAELTQLLPTLRPAWLLRKGKEEEERKSSFFATDLTAVFAFSDFKPLRPTRNTVSQRTECFLYELHEHIIIKEWYVWQAIILLAQTLGDPTPEIPDSFKPPVPKPYELAEWNNDKGNTTASNLPSDTLPKPSSISTPQPEPSISDSQPWAEIEALAERIKLRKNGAFTPPSKWVAAAMAGMIDALCEAEILPPSGELKRLYAEFSRYYGRKIGVDRIGPIRLAWQKKARKELKLE